MGVTTAGHASDTKYLSELKTECFEKTESFKEKQALRTEEIDAIGQVCCVAFVGSLQWSKDFSF